MTVEEYSYKYIIKIESTTEDKVMELQYYPYNNGLAFNPVPTRYKNKSPHLLQWRNQ